MTMPTIRAAEILRDFAPLSPGDSITLNWEEANALFDAARRGVEAEGAIGNLKTACEVSNRVAHERAERAEAALAEAVRREREACASYAENHDLGTPDGHDIAKAIRARKGEHDVASEILDDLNAAIKAAQPPEYPSAADDEATRWRHGEPSAISDERIAKIYAEETGFDLHKEPAALLDFARALLSAQPSGWVSVPREPTREMWDAAWNSIGLPYRAKLSMHEIKILFEKFHEAMLAAAPKEPK